MLCLPACPAPCAPCLQYTFAMRHSPAEACRHILQQPDAALGGLEIAYVVFDVWATLQGQQQEDEGSAGGSSSSSSSSAAAARLPLVGPLDSQRQGLL